MSTTQPVSALPNSPSQGASASPSLKAALQPQPLSALPQDTITISAAAKAQPAAAPAQNTQTNKPSSLGNRPGK